MGKKAKTDEKVREFNSIAEFDASTSKEGDVTTQVFLEVHQIRRIIHRGEAHYSVVDVVAALSETKGIDAGGYWRALKKRLLDEGGNEAVTNCNGLKLRAQDGKLRITDCANIKTLLRIIQSIPSTRAEPFKKWLAQVGFERIQESAEPDKAARRMVHAYRELGYSDDWIERRIRHSVIDTGWSEEVASRGVSKQGETHIRGKAHEIALGVSQKQHRDLKGVKSNADLPDTMNTLELLIDTLTKAASSEIMKARSARGLGEVSDAAETGARIAGNTRRQIEEETKQSIVTSDRTLAQPVDKKLLDSGGERG